MPEPSNDNDQRGPDHDVRRQRSKAVRTALVLAAIALIIFAAFVLSGVMGTPRAP